MKPRVDLAEHRISYFAWMSSPTASDLYLDLLKRTLTRAVFEDSDSVVGTSHPHVRWKRGLARVLGKGLSAAHMELVLKRPYRAEARENGIDWPARAESMIGLRRMDNIQYCVETVLRDDVPGDLIETGVWRGGACIFMRGVLKAHGDTTRRVWVADSFEGLPPPDSATYPADSADELHRNGYLRVGVEQVKHNFERYGLLDDQVQFLVGWFKDTLPTAPIERLAVLRLDGDMYESTINAVEAMYPKLSPGGFCIVDDYFVGPGCKMAIHEYREAHGITEPIVDIDGTACYWRVRGS